MRVVLPTLGLLTSLACSYVSEVVYVNPTHADVVVTWTERPDTQPCGRRHIGTPEWTEPWFGDPLVVVWPSGDELEPDVRSVVVPAGKALVLCTWMNRSVSVHEPILAAQVAFAGEGDVTPIVFTVRGEGLISQTPPR
jgi:hypothetical protein